MAQNVVYYGIFIDKESKNKLKSLVPRTAYKVYCDHMTLAHSSTFTDDVVNTCNELLGKEFTITATTIGKSKDAMAVGIETDCFSVNNHKHITLCTMTPSSKPVQSNYIENWVKLKKPIILKGTVMAFTNNGLIKENRKMKKLIRLTESDLHRIVKESVNRVLKEGAEFSSDVPGEEWMHYTNKLQDVFNELSILIRNKVPKNDPDRMTLERYIRMIQTHLHTLE